jgi:hypothetical protein
VTYCSAVASAGYRWRLPTFRYRRLNSVSRGNRAGTRSDRIHQRVESALIRKEPLLRIPIDRKTSVIFQTLGRKADGLSPHADRFNYRRRQESERDHMAYIAVAQTFSVRDLFG